MEYRIVLLERGRAVSLFYAQCDDDDDAVGLAGGMLWLGLDAEIWQGSRKVGADALAPH